MPEETPNTILNFNDALSLLQKTSENYYTQIYIPSLKTEIPFKEINANQQKSLIKAGVDESIFASNFIEAVYNIIKDNVGDGYEYKSLTTFDKISIILSLKEKISKNITVKKDKVSIEYPVEKLIKQFKEVTHPIPVKIIVFYNDEPLLIQLSYPTIENEYRFEQELREDKNIKIESTEDLQKVLSDAFVSEITKYIDFIEINTSQIVFDNFKYKDRIKIVEKLPTSIVQQALEQISAWKKTIDDALYAEKGEEKKKTKIPIAIDATFFLS